MAVYKRGYQRYTGPYTSHSARVLAFPRFAWKRIMGQRLTVIVMMASLFWPLACAAFVYLSNHTGLFQGFEPSLAKWLKIDGKFFVIFMDVQTVAAVVLAALAGPGLVAPDLTDNALPLYLSRPLSRLDYVLARLLVLAGILSVVTWAPGVLLFGMQSGMAGRTWFSANWKLCAGLLAGFGVLILLVSLVALASSAWVRWRAVAGALVLAFFSVLAGAAGIVYAILEAEWSALLNPASTLHRVWCYLLGVDPPAGPTPLASAAALGLMCVLLCWVLERKLRPVEVVS
jgi:ABC-2 type transport system permease protein